MAFFSYTRPVADGVFGRSLGFSFGELFARLATWNDERLTRNALSKLSDRDLNDIGLSRSDIAGLVGGRR